METNKQTNNNYQEAIVRKLFKIDRKLNSRNSMLSSQPSKTRETSSIELNSAQKSRQVNIACSLKYIYVVTLHPSMIIFFRPR